MTAGMKPGWCILHGVPEPCFTCNSAFQSVADLGLSGGLSGTVIVGERVRSGSVRMPVFVAVRTPQAPGTTYAYPVADPVFAERVTRTAAGDLSWLAELIGDLDTGDVDDLNEVPVADPRCCCGCGR